MSHQLRPTAGQLAWQADQIGMFFHLGINTYFDQEWSDGSLPAEAFNPIELDCDQWMRSALAIGAKYVVLTAKHHDGFCLWPTRTTDYSVSSSPWRDGQGDVVREYVDAARRAGLKVGLYLSPWDRHAPEYADAARYSSLYCQQLTELCTGYGEIAELWFDGAGSEGYQYDWDAIVDVIHREQPGAMVFNMGAPTIRWVGNEDGLASDPVEYVVHHTQMSNYTVHMTEFAEALYLPPECDVSIRRGWFHTKADEPKSLEHLMAIYYRSVGLGANLLLNVPPNRQGLLDPADAARLAEFGGELERRFGRGVTLPIEQVDQGRWTITIDETGIDHIVLREDLAEGQRARAHRLVVDEAVVAQGQTIGSQRLHLTGPLPVGVVTLEVEGEGVRLAGVTGHATGVDRLPRLPEGYVAPTECPE